MGSGVWGVPRFQLSRVHMRDGINIGDMLVILAAAVLHPSPARAIMVLFFPLEMGVGDFQVMRSVHVCALTGWNNSYMFVSWLMSASGRPSEGHNSSNVSPLTDFPASCLIVLWVKSCILLDLTLLNTFSIPISDVHQDTLATHCVDRCVQLVAMKSMVPSAF